MKQTNKRKGARKPLVRICVILALAAVVLVVLFFPSGSGEAGSGTITVLQKLTGQVKGTLSSAANGVQASGEGTDTDGGSASQVGGAEGTESDGAYDPAWYGSGESGAAGGQPWTGNGNFDPETMDALLSDPALSDPEALDPENTLRTGTQTSWSSGGSYDQPETVTLPYEIPSSNLVVRQISSYSGSFLEDGSDQDVSNVTVIILENEGREPVEYASITMNRSDGAALEFEATDIQAGATVVIQEKNKAAYRQTSFDSCTASVAEVDTLEFSNDVSVEETEDGSLLVTNLSGQDISCVRVFYKFYMEDEDAYVGGITYVAKLTDLAAGDAQTVMPSHYQSGYSKVVMVRTYDTAE